MSDAPFIWRSLLFIPADREEFVSKAHQRGADAYILDLEDSIPLARKPNARAAIADEATLLARQGNDVLVRINADSIQLDLEAIVCDTVKAVVLPKAGEAAAIQDVAGHLDKLERDRGLSPGHTRVIALIEDIHALLRLDEIASSSPRLMAMTLGSEDFSVSSGMTPTISTMLWPSQQVVFACRRAGLYPLGFPASIAEYTDLDLLRRAIALARDLGFVGAFCIHPKQVAILNELFSPSETEVAEAKALLQAFEETKARGVGAFAFKGRMVDPPVVARAREIVKRSESIAGHDRAPGTA